MMVNSSKQIDTKTKQLFGLSDFTSLRNCTNKIRLELGGEHDSKERVEVATRRSIEILNNIFYKKDIWLRIVSWEKEIDPVLQKLIQTKSIKFRKESRDKTIYYAYCPEYSPDYILDLVKSSTGYELGLENTYDIGCLYINFDIPVIVNIYDDRGVDIVTTDSKTMLHLSDMYSKWITF